MENLRLRRLVSSWVLGALLVVSSTHLAEEETLPGWEEYVEPLRSGSYTGHVAFPALYSGDHLLQILSPVGYEIRMTDADRPGEERVFAAGLPFRAPRSRRWRFWLQGEWTMTPYSTIGRFGKRGLEEGEVRALFLPVAPAGRVMVQSGAFEASQELWLLYVGGRPEGRDYELSRRRPIPQAESVGVLMPADRVLAAIWDPDREQYVAVSAPFQVLEESFVPAPVQAPPNEAAQVLVHLREPGALEPRSHADVHLVVSRGDLEFAPDFTFATAWGLYAVWYSLPPGPAVLSGGNGALYLAPQTLELAGGRVASLDGDLTRRPILDVRLALDARLRERPFMLEVRKLPDGQLLSQAQLSRTAGSHRFTDLVQDLVEVSLVTHLGTFRQRIDLSGREEASLLLEPELLDFFGTVRWGGEPHAARLEWVTAQEKVAVATDEEGRYQATLLQPLRLVTVDLEEVDQEPWTEVFMPGLDESQELDFEIPDADVQVRVVDDSTGQAISGARVAVRSVYWKGPTSPRGPASGNEKSADDERVFAQSYETDDEGLAHLPPPRQGRIEVGATAEGYRPSTDDLVVAIDDPSVDRDLEVRLKPLGEGREIRLLLPDGSPAAGARVWRVDSLVDPQVIDSSLADSAGRVWVPLEPAGGFLLLKPPHPDTSFAIEEWNGWSGKRNGEWTFQPAAGPLTLRVLDPSGREPVRQAEIALWVEGRKLTGWLLRMLVGGPPWSDAAGFFKVTGLPPGPVFVLAWETSARAEEAAGLLDNLATEVSYPWPQTLEIRAVR